MSIASPYELLKQLDDRCRRNASGLPVAGGVAEDWLGIGFSIKEVPLLARMDEVSEILPMPDTVRVPGVKSWVIGLANIRGNLMPVLDMNAFLHGTPTRIRKESRILVINSREEHRDEAMPDAGTLGEYLSGIFIDQVRRWNVFSVEKLAGDDPFLRVIQA